MTFCRHQACSGLLLQAFFCCQQQISPISSDIPFCKCFVSPQNLPFLLLKSLFLPHSCLSCHRFRALCCQEQGSLSEALQASGLSGETAFLSSTGRLTIRRQRFSLPF